MKDGRAMVAQSVANMDTGEKQGLLRTTSLDKLPPDVEALLLPPVSLNLAAHDPALLETRFDLSVSNAPAQAFFMSLVKDTPYNMVVHPNTQGVITLNLKNVNIEEVMQSVRDIYGMEYRRTATGYEVLANTLESRIYRINYLNVQRKGASQIRVSSGQISESKNNGQNTGNDNQNSQSEDARRATVSGSQVNTYSQSDFWLELSTALRAIVGEEGGRKVVVNAHSGVVVVRAMPSELREVEAYLKTTQNIIQRQVILEAKILEVELKDAFQSGINWTALLTSGGKSITIGQTGGGSVFNGGNASQLAGLSGIFSPSALGDALQSTTGSFGGVFTAALDLGDFKAFIEALEAQGNVHVLSSPRVSTINNQKAVIKVGTDEFFVTDINTETNDNSNVLNQTVDVELTPFFSGVALDVIPQINESGDVTMYVHPSVSEVTEQEKQIDITTRDTLSVPLAMSTIRESDSIVRANSGQVVVIGGLMQNIVANKDSGVPLLKHLLLVGGLFRHEQKGMRKSELVILLKPIVVEDDQVWSQYLQQRKDSFNELLESFGAERSRLD